MYKIVGSDFFEVISDGIYGKGTMGRLIDESHINLTREEYMLKDSGRSWELLQELNRGKYTERRYWEQVIAENNWDVTPEDMMELTDQVVHYSVPGTADVLQQLNSEGYTLILISDLWQELKERVLLAYPWINQLFTKRYFSSDYGKIKSDPGYFEFILNDIGANPEEMIFIDDYHVNVTRAGEAGIKGILFENAIQLRKDLVSMGTLRKHSPKNSRQQ